MNSAGGFLGYFSTMYFYGFSYTGLLKMTHLKGHTFPHENDVFNPLLPNLGNSNLGNPFDPDYNCNNFNDSNGEAPKLNIEWLWMNDAKYDLRMTYVKCNTGTKRFETSVSWEKCLDESTISPVTNTRVCYGTEALKYA